MAFIKVYTQTTGEAWSPHIDTDDGPGSYSQPSFLNFVRTCSFHHLQGKPKKSHLS